jgi:23S rRNA pseudouridine2605 synthase
LIFSTRHLNATPENRNNAENFNTRLRFFAATRRPAILRLASHKKLVSAATPLRSSTRISSRPYQRFAATPFSANLSSMEERLQKIIARAGLASRRHAEQMITSGLVTVNGRLVTELGGKADASRDHIKVSGKLLKPASELVYIMFNKPAEVVSTMSDPEGRRCVSDFLHGIRERVFPVGRLEYHSSGLLLLTNDGNLANRMMAADRLTQTYQLKLKTLLTFAEIEALTRATGARISRRRGKDSPWYDVTLADARRDLLRKRLFQTGHPVEKIRRVGLANLELDTLPPGQHRPLSGGEVAALSRVIDTGMPPPEKRKFRPKPLDRARSQDRSHGRPNVHAQSHDGSQSHGRSKFQGGPKSQARSKPYDRTKSHERTNAPVHTGPPDRPKPHDRSKTYDRSQPRDRSSSHDRPTRHDRPNLHERANSRDQSKIPDWAKGPRRSKASAPAAARPVRRRTK